MKPRHEVLEILPGKKMLPRGLFMTKPEAQQHMERLRKANPGKRYTLGLAFYLDNPEHLQEARALMREQKMLKALREPMGCVS